MNNHQFDNIEMLIDKDADLDERLFDEDKRPKAQEIIQFLESIRDLAQLTEEPDDFALALKLFQKWKVNLLSYYEINYRQRISRSGYDFSLAARYQLTDSEIKRVFDEKSLKDINNIWGLSESKSDDGTKQEQSKERDDEPDSFDNSPFFPKN